VHASPKFGFDLVQFRLQALAGGLPQHREATVAPLLRADVREAEEVGFRLRPKRRLYLSRSAIPGYWRLERRFRSFGFGQRMPDMPKSTYRAQPPDVATRKRLDSE
jgi:hypothetical protein